MLVWARVWVIRILCMASGGVSSWLSLTITVRVGKISGAGWNMCRIVPGEGGLLAI